MFKKRNSPPLFFAALLAKVFPCPLFGSIVQFKLAKSCLFMKNWNEYSIQHFLFILSQSEKKLNETVETMKTIQSRGRFQLLFSLSVIVSLIGWWITEHNQVYEPYAVSVAVVSLVSVFFSAWGIYQYSISTVGSPAEILLDDRFYSSFDKTEYAEKNLVFNECKDYSKRIERNTSINRKRLQLVTLSFLTMCLTPVVLLLTYLLSRC